MEHRSASPGDALTDFYDDMAQGLAAEAAAMQPPPRPNVHALPEKAYLEATVLPLLLHGLEAVAKDRPKDPIEFLAAYLLSNNPQRDQPLPLPPGVSLLAGAAAPTAVVQ